MDEEVKNLGGRPPFYKTPEELQAKIDEYFVSGVTKRIVIVGKGDNRKEIEIEVPTIAGMCYFLGFASRQSFYDYESRDGFAYTVKRARLFIEQEYEEMLHEGNTVGAIFALKNFGWTDNQNLNIGGQADNPIEIVADSESAKRYYANKLALLSAAKEAGDALIDG